MAWTDKLAQFLRLNDGEQAYTGYPQMQVGLNKPRQAGYATGFLEGATGMESMQPKDPITDPNYDQYAQGKNTGEAAGIGAMAIPGYAMALRAGAPKAYNALENYMVKSGGMIPLEAYHGTPHKIEGGFDINKVGTGQGTQNFGHGVYFAENPTVAQGFMGRTVIQEPKLERFTFNGPDYSISNGEYLKSGKPIPKAEYEKAFQGITNLFNTQNKGNLYKVDIPDAMIPKMIDWYEDVPEDVRKRISTKAMEQFGSGISPTTGEKLYKEIAFSLKQAGSTNPKADASKWLAEQGVPGVKYENFQIKKGQGADTKNFVVFEPSKVNILEENATPVSRKAILEEQVSKLKE